MLGLVDELRYDYGLEVLTTMHDLTLAGGAVTDVLTQALIGRY